MKILMLGSGSFNSSLNIRIEAFGRHLAEAGNDVDMLVPSADKYNNFKSTNQDQFGPINLLRVWQLHTGSNGLNFFSYLLGSVAKVLTIKTDVVYLYKPTPITIIGLLPHFIYRKTLILDLDDLGSEVMKAQGQARLAVKLVAGCEKLALRYSSAVVVSSSFLKSIAQTKYPNKPVVCVPNGVEPADYKYLESPKPRPAIYYFGAINRLSLIVDLLKSLPVVIQAVPETKVTILGGGSALSEAKTLVRRLGLANNVEFSGWIKMKDINKYVQFGDIAVCYQPDTRTVRAASNMKVFQYMALGSVSVVSDVGDLADYLNNTEAGVVIPPGDVLRLTKELVNLLNDPVRRAKLAGSARSRVELIYSWKTQSSKIAVFIESQLKGKRLMEKSYL